MDNEVLESVKSTAQSYTYRGKVLSFINPNFPLAVFADGYASETQGSGEPLSETMVASVEDHFAESNETAPASVEEERESIIANTRTGVAQLQFNTQNVLIPAIKEMCNAYSDIHSAQMQPDINVEIFKLSAIHQDSGLTTHLSDTYSNYQVMSEYKTYILEATTADKIIDLVSYNNKHLSREVAAEWALSIGAEKIMGVWNALFSGDRVLSMSQLHFMRIGTHPFNTDEIALAYFILAAYRDNPVDTVIGESVTLEEWTANMEALHCAFGRALLGSYQRRADSRAEQELVFKYEVAKVDGSMRIKVLLNGDVADEWLAANTVEAILGAAVKNPNIKTVPQMNEVKVEMAEVWGRTYPLLKQATLDTANAKRRNSITKAFMQNVELLSALEAPENAQVKVEALLNAIPNQELDNHFLLFTKLVCKVTETDYIYQEYLNAIDEYSHTFPNATAQELETQALITVVALYMARQITMVDFKPEIDDTPAATEEPAAVEDEELEETPELEPETSDDDLGEDLGEADTEEAPELEGEESTDEETAEAEEPETNETKDMMGELDDLDASEEDVK